MSKNPFVSIIIPFYNTPEKDFRRCINSLINQTNGNFEAIVVNDCSSNEYNNVLRETVSLDNRIRLVNKEKNEGLAVTRNVGISKANCEYIMFLDSDDTITAYCLEEAAHIIEECQPDLIIGAFRRVTEKDVDTFHPKKNSKLNLLKVESDEVKTLLMNHMIGFPDETFMLQKGYIGDSACARILRKSIAENTLFSKEAFWSEDTIWNLNMLKKCENIIIIDDLWYKYLINPNSMTHGFRPNCPYEFDYRTKQELNLSKKLWHNCMEGIYIRIFNDINILGKTFLFHPNNPKSRKEIYQIYKACIHNEAYREALKGINLKKDKRIINRTMKEIFRFTAYYGPNIISYWILKAFYYLRKNTL